MLLKLRIQPFITDQPVVLVPLAFSRVYFDKVHMEKQYRDYLAADGKRRKASP